MNTKDLRKILSPRGNKPIVVLTLENKFFNHTFIEACIRQLEISALMQYQLNPLEKLGAMILYDSTKHV